MEIKNEIAVFGGGCFWCTEAIFSKLKGVTSVKSGYAGGVTDKPSYYDVSEGNTGHAEVVKIEFDPQIISYEQLLKVFFATHDPTTPNQQGNDTGTQYRSIIFHTIPQQKQSAELCLTKQSEEFTKKIVTEIKPLEKFYDAETYHQKYYDKNISAPYCEFVISPKLEKLQNKFSHLLKSV